MGSSQSVAAVSPHTETEFLSHDESVFPSQCDSSPPSDSEEEAAKPPAAVVHIDHAASKRLQAVTLLQDAEWTIKRVANRFKVSTRTVRRWKQRTVFEAGWMGERKKSTGRPPTITKEIGRKFYQAMKGKKRRSLRRSVKLLQQGVGKKVAPSTLSRYLKTKTNLKPFHPVRTPNLSTEKKARRLRFAQLYLDHDWDSTYVTDEKFFPLIAPLNTKNDIVWDSKSGRNDRARYITVGVQVWAGISSFGKTDLVFLEGKKDSKNYIDQCIDTQLGKMRSNVGRRRWWLQQDGAKKHTSHYTLAELARRRINAIPPEH